MASYTPTTNFAAKDSLPSNDPNKVVKGAEFTDEFEAISTTFSGVAPTLDPVFTGTVTAAGISASSITLTGNATAAGITATDITYTGVLTGPDGALATEQYATDLVNAAVLAPITGFDSLADVNVTNVTDGQTIVWNNTAGEWVPLAGSLFLNVDANSVKSDVFVETVRSPRYQGSSATLELNLANNFAMDFSSATGYALGLSGAPSDAGDAYGFTLTLDTTNMTALAWDTKIKWSKGTAPALTAGITYVFTFITTDNGTTFKGFVGGEAFA
jgi:hypothetical protein